MAQFWCADFFLRSAYSWFLLLLLRAFFCLCRMHVEIAQTDISLSTFCRQNWCLLGKPTISDILERPLLKYLLLYLLSLLQTISFFPQHGFSKAFCSERFLCYPYKVLIMLSGFILQFLKGMSLDIFPVRK